jgi:hypothetical protein
MALSRNALDELRRELAEVRQRRTILDAHIQGLELVLSAEQNSGRLADSLDSDARSLRFATQPKRSSVTRRREKGSFRKTVLDALQKAPGSKCADLVRLIEDEGFQINGSTSLRNRISHEIYRLRRLGVVRRERGGLYVVTQAKENPDKRQPQNPDSSRSDHVSLAV